MIYLHQDCFKDLDDPEGLRKAVQLAVQIELATIPVYLYSLYSLMPGTNDPVAEILSSVVREEMLHLALACNLLNAIGGHPILLRSDVTPRYPARFPQGTELGPVLSLKPFSLEHLKLFLAIEEPENPIQDEAAVRKPTVGNYYRAIEEAIGRIGSKLFKGSDPSLQIREGFDAILPIDSVASASEGIDLIVEQGEGTPQSRQSPTGGYAHYYRFEQIARGKALKIGGGSDAVKDCFSGALIHFDPAEVYPIPDNPKASLYPVGTRARVGCDQFNDTYVKLLRSLERMVNGEPSKLQDAMGLMFSLKHQAKDLMSGCTTGKIPVGPSFECF